MSGIMARYSEVPADKKGLEAKIYIAESEKRNSAEKVGGFVCNKRGYLAKDYR